MGNGRIALVDMDGTLSDFDTAMRVGMEKLKGPNEPSLFHDYRDEDNPWLEARRDLIKAQPGFWLGLQRLELGFQILDLIRKMGFETHILTKGPRDCETAWTEKVQWARKHLPDTPITVTTDKSLTYGRVLVDDWVPYIERWMKWRPRGLVIVPAQKWNESFSFPNVLRVDKSTFEDFSRLTILKNALTHQLERP